MLVLTRKVNEAVSIDDQIEVMVVAVRGNKVKLGFRAPANVSIQRQERAAVALEEPRRSHPEVSPDCEDTRNDLVELYFGGARTHGRPR
jgi:carbon storage regulator CsrA